MIETTCSSPITSRYRCLDPVKLEVARKEFANMEAQGIVTSTSSNWVSPLHMVKKAASIRHFRFLVEGSSFFILSDHKPMIYALHWLSDPWSLVSTTAAKPGLRGRIHMRDLPNTVVFTNKRSQAKVYTVYFRISSV